MRRVAKERDVHALQRSHLPGGFGRVRHDPPILRHRSQALKREAIRRDVDGVVLLRIDGAEEEQLVRDDRPADFCRRIVLSRAGDVHGPVRRLDLRPRRLEPFGRK